MADKNVVEIVLQAVDKASKPIQNLRKSLDKTFAPVRQLSNSFQALEKASGLSQVAKSFGEVESKVGNLKNLVVGTATTVATSVAVIGGAFAFLAKGTIESADNMLSLSKQTGVTVEGLQKLRFIASQTGSSTEDLDNGLKKFTVNMGLARAGQGALYQILARVNPEILRQMLATKSNEQAFMLMLQTIQKLPKAQQQAALSQVAFGRGNISLVATAKAGNEEWAKLGKRMEEIGLITQAQAEEANATADAWGEFFLAIQRARDAVMIQALPALKELAKTFTQFLIDNKAAIEEWGKEFAKKLPDILNGLVTALKLVATILSPLVSLFAFLGRHTLLLNLVIGFLAELFALKLAFAIYNVIKAIAAMNLVLAATPIGWIIIAITALVGVAILLYTYWDKVVSIWKVSVNWMEKLIGLTVDLTKALMGMPTALFTRLGIVHDSTNDPIVGTARGAPGNTNKSETAVKVTFDNLPKGARVSSMSKDDILDLSMGYAMQ